MKTTIRLATILFLFTTILFDGCKKGENDPFLSLKSRKARVAGEWKLTSGTITFSSSGFSGTATLDGVNLTADGFSTPYTVAFELDKDGTFKRTTTDDGDIEIETGTWDFNSGVGEAKKKELLVLTTLTDTYDGDTETYSGSDAPIETFVLDELRSKKMVVTMDGSYNDGTDTETTTGSFTFEQ